MEGKDNPNAARRERAVRPVRKRTDGNSDPLSGRNSEQTGRSGGEGSTRSTSSNGNVRRQAKRSSSSYGTEDRELRRSTSASDSEGRQPRKSASAGENEDRPLRRSTSARSSGGENRPPRRSTSARSSGGEDRPLRRSSSRSSGENGDTPLRRSTSSGNGTARKPRRSSPAGEGEDRTLRRSNDDPYRRDERENDRLRKRNTASGQSGDNVNVRIKRKNSPDLTGMAVNPKVIGAVAAVLLIVIGIIIGVRSFGSSHRSGVNAMKALIKASVAGDIDGMKDAYGINGDVMVDMQESLDAAIAYYKAHNPKKVAFKSSGKLFEEGNYTYIYLLYDLELDEDQVYPCITTDIVQNVEGKYYVLPPSKVTEDLSQKATESYQKFMTTNIYKNYIKEYDTFIKKNPGYEDKIAARLA